MIRFSRRPLHGDFFKTRNDVYFTVIGNTHPPDKIVSYPRYVPHPDGDRKLGSQSYLRLQSLKGCQEFLGQHFSQSLVYDPVFDETLCEIPMSQIVDYLYPEGKLAEMHKATFLDAVRKTARDFCLVVMKSSGISPEQIGISGSILCGLHTEASDIDIILYGVAPCRRVHSRLQKLLDSSASDFRRHKTREMRRLYELRSRDTTYPSLKGFCSAERRKSCQGFFREREFFVRFIKPNPREKYSGRRYENLGKVGLTASVIEDEESIFTPCKYGVAKCESRSRLGHFVKEVTSFRGRFCEQAVTADRIQVQGKLEKVEGYGEHYLRVIVGNELEDCMIRLK